MSAAGQSAPLPDVSDCKLLLTAAEAFPALERAILAARERVVLSFRVIDLATRLRSDEGRAVGETWADLLADALSRGVSIRLVVADFDPIGAPELHRMSWHTIRQCAAVREMAGDEAAPFEAIAALHPARIGKVLGIFLWAVAATKLHQAAGIVNHRPEAARERFLSEAPRLRTHLVKTDSETHKVRPNWWQRFSLAPVTHHQKLAVIDGKRLFIGGLDLDERRWDTPEHSRMAQDTWHDIQMLFDEPALAAQAERHVDLFLDQTAGKPGCPPPLGQPEMRPATEGLRFITTLSRPSPMKVLRFAPETASRGIYAAHIARTAQAKRLIYLESQFFRDTHLARVLAAHAAAEPGLNCLLVLPAAPEEVAFNSGGTDARYGEYLQARALRKLRRAFGERLFIASPAQRRRPESPSDEVGEAGVGEPDGTGREKHGGLGRAALFGAPVIYVHAKLSVFDEAAAIVSSANLNGRSMKWDSEAGVEMTRRGDVEMIRERVVNHWFPDATEAQRDRLSDPLTAREAWENIARSDAARSPEDRQSFLLPFDLRSTARFGHQVPGIPEQMV